MSKPTINFSLLKRPKKVKARTQTRYVYAPSIVTTNTTLKPGDIISILEVYQGDSPSETTLKVMRTRDYNIHRSVYDGNPGGCTFYYTDKTCECEKPVEQITNTLREQIHFVLLSDIGN